MSEPTVGSKWVSRDPLFEHKHLTVQWVGNKILVYTNDKGNEFTARPDWFLNAKKPHVEKPKVGETWVRDGSNVQILEVTEKYVVYTYFYPNSDAEPQVGYARTFESFLAGSRRA